MAAAGHVGDDSRTPDWPSFEHGLPSLGEPCFFSTKTQTLLEIEQLRAALPAGGAPARLYRSRNRAAE
jgi:hypothetical protein